MTKRQLIDEIVSINQSAQPGFLARFGDGELNEYLRHLHLTRTPRLSGDRRRYEKYFPGASAAEAPAAPEAPQDSAGLTSEEKRTLFAVPEPADQTEPAPAEPQPRDDAPVQEPAAEEETPIEDSTVDGLDDGDDADTDKEAYDDRDPQPADDSPGREQSKSPADVEDESPADEEPAEVEPDSSAGDEPAEPDRDSTDEELETAGAAADRGRSSEKSSFAGNQEETESFLF